MSEATGERRDPMLRRWELLGLAALLVLVIVIPVAVIGDEPRPGELAEAEPEFVGSASCKDCHEAAYELWTGSDHDLAMDHATEATVLGDFDDALFEFQGVETRFYRRDGGFFVFTEGSDGEMTEFEVEFVFGHEPLQQYLVPFPGGRYQCLSVTWDTVEKRWFRQYPDHEIPHDDWLHWSRQGQNWNGMCAECHSTNLQKNYDPQTDSYDTTWSDIDVGCEACHGPGSTHVAWAEVDPMARAELPNHGLSVQTSEIEPQQLVELCAPCHSRHSELGDYDHSDAELLDHLLPSLLEERLYHDDGQILDEVYVYGSFLQSKMHQRGVSCRDCHDSHSGKLHFEDNRLCLQCHQADAYDSTAHHFHQLTEDGEPAAAAQCRNCHMVEQPFMVVDWRADHSFRVPRPDLTEAIGTPNACMQSGCHDDKPLDYSLDAYRKWYGEASKPHFGTTFHSARAGDPAAIPELVRLAESDLSSPIVRATALELLSRAPTPDSAATLRATLQSEDPLLRRTAAEFLPLMSADDIERIAALLSDPVLAVRLSAVSRLAPTPRELLKPYQLEAFERGVEEYRRAMAHALDFPGGAHNLGNLEAALGDTAAAERYYRRALSIDELFVPAKTNLAILLSQQGRNQEAEKLLREAAEAYPDNGEVTYLLGLLVVENGQPEEAVRWLTRTADLVPGHSRARYNLGLLLQQQGSLDEAGRRLGEAVQLEPGNFDYLYAYVDHLLKRGRVEAARPYAQRMIELQPDNPVCRQLGQILRAK